MGPNSFFNGLKNVVASVSGTYVPAFGDGPGLHLTLTLTGNATIGPATNVRPGQRLLLELIQDGTGSRTVTLDASYKRGTATATVSATGNTANKVSTMEFIASGTGSRTAPVFQQCATQQAYA